MLACLIGLASVMGCASREERCRTAQAEAQQAWSTYRAALEERRQRATELRADTLLSMSKLSAAISAVATEATNRLYDRGPAWQRHYQVAFEQACLANPECAQGHEQQKHADADLAALADLIGAVVTAGSKAVSNPTDAWSAAQRVETDAHDSLAVAARQAALRAAEQCDVKIE